MSHALLLRLFLTPFFSVHVALQYLTIYADNVGVTYYITRRLRELDILELRDVWGFICHLLLTRPSRSRALECFVIDTAQRSTHIAMVTLWFMQAALKDLSGHPHNSPQFMTCQRVLHRCHEIIFGDLPQTVAPYSILNLPFQSRFMRKKIKHHRDPVIVGIGMVLAGAPALPQLTEIMGQVAIEQGRVEETGSEERSIESSEDLASPGGAIVDDPEEIATDADDGSVEESPTVGSAPPTNNLRQFNPGSLGRRNVVGAAQTSPALPLYLHGIRRSRNSEDPLGQLDAEQLATPSQSSPSISTSRPTPRTASLNYADTILQNYDMPSQIHLLRSNYCRSEVGGSSLPLIFSNSPSWQVSFILTLENICDRLLVVPRPARVSALRAELTSLNHKLPAEVCMPMWCNSADTPQSSRIPHPHHRIVRIPPGESVVLNSAERAPYLLYIEILNDDLDFDPQKRNNKDLLKKIVLKENERSTSSRGLDTFSSPSSSQLRKSLPIHDDDVAIEESTVVTPAHPLITPPTPTSAPDEEEEMDLVEQLYGPDQSLRSQAMDLSDSIVLPPPPKNKDLDMAACSSPLPLPLAPNESTNSYSLSLDEYSERMRTAAIMLAQLNASLVRDLINSTPANAPPESSSGPLSWIPGSAWLSGSTDDSTKTTSPSRYGTGSQDLGKPAPSRMRLQPAEASAIRDRIMNEMLALEEERMSHMRENREAESIVKIGDISGGLKTAEDEGIIRRELSKADPSAMVFSESWATKKSRIRHGSPYGHLANWDCVSVIIKTGGDLRQEQLAVQLIHEFQRIWEEESCACWVRYFRILITGGTSGLVETITDAVSIHSIKKAEYARRLAEGRLGHVTLFDHFKNTYGDPSSAKFARAQKNFAKSLAGYSVVTYLLQIKDRHNGNILLDRDGHLIHIDFGFMLANTPGNIRFEAAPFKLPPEYIEVLGGVNGAPFLEFRKLFREGFEAARKHCDRIVTIVELMQKDSTLPCFAIFGEQTAVQLRDRFQPALTHSAVGELVDRLIDSSLGSHWTRLYDTYQYYSQSIL
ncbi:hypothetical protein D9758_003331 [Tetrapyrgos nigripes]|uniref:1-phosphatidylinositol 4-kinase n=1 Tax=Tetrapyrgos nigripes TaxID=182062 RepID=A0A8H5GIN3_9AGAR|nr:hypothetical protein D9758_003331 [Tetrapyrgos nigripes]